jgi:GNAT superfamily N-acetyltransferase
MAKVKRFFLEIKRNKSLNTQKNLTNKIKIYLDKEKNININKFFYRQIGIDHFWRDRLLWPDKEWQRYVDNTNLQTGIMKLDGEMIGFYEQELHKEKNEIELIQMGVLKEHQGKKFGSLLLEHIISEAFDMEVERIWVHTCSLDHKYALGNYLSKGFKVFKEETINFTF